MRTKWYRRSSVLLLLMCFAGATLFVVGLFGQDESWQIVRADYGFKNQRTDVTDILRDLIARGGVNGRVAVNNQTMGGDPAIGRDKNLRIFARNRRNEQREFDYREGGFIDATLFIVRRDDSDGHDGDRGHDADRDRDRDHGDRDRDDARALVILRGYYGVQGHTVNVTDALRSRVRDGVLSLNVSNENLGGDPAIGANKVLIVVYTYRGEEQAAAAWEGSRLTLP